MPPRATPRGSRGARRCHRSIRCGWRPGALVAALDAVTRGPVAAESVALPEISRQSPLAPWKMLIRAIQAFYGNEDALCEKYLAAVEPAAAAERLVPAIRAMRGRRDAHAQGRGAGEAGPVGEPCGCVPRWPAWTSI